MTRLKSIRCKWCKRSSLLKFSRDARPRFRFALYGKNFWGECVKCGKYQEVKL